MSALALPLGPCHATGLLRSLGQFLPERCTLRILSSPDSCIDFTRDFYVISRTTTVEMMNHAKQSACRRRDTRQLRQHDELKFPSRQLRIVSTWWAVRRHADAGIQDKANTTS